MARRRRKVRRNFKLRIKFRGKLRAYRQLRKLIGSKKARKVWVRAAKYHGRTPVAIAGLRKLGKRRKHRRGYRKAHRRATRRIRRGRKHGKRKGRKGRKSAKRGRKHGKKRGSKRRGSKRKGGRRRKLSAKMSRRAAFVKKTWHSKLRPKLLRMKFGAAARFVQRMYAKKYGKAAN